jgi:hypothetical protein
MGKKHIVDAVAVQPEDEAVGLRRGIEGCNQIV